MFLYISKTTLFDCLFEGHCQYKLSKDSHYFCFFFIIIILIFLNFYIFTIEKRILSSFPILEYF